MRSGWNEFAPRHYSDDRQVRADVDHGDCGGADHYRSRNDTTWLAHLAAHVTHVVVAEVVVDPDAGRRAQSEEKTEREIESARRKVERNARVQMHCAGD